MELLLKCLIIGASATLFLLLNAYCIAKFIYEPTKKKVTYLSYNKLMDHLMKVINTELTVIELTELRNRKSFSNSDYEHYSRLITTRIFDALSPEYISILELYITREHIASVVLACVESYLNRKVPGMQ